MHTLQGFTLHLVTSFPFFQVTLPGQPYGAKLHSQDYKRVLKVYAGKSKQGKLIIPAHVFQEKCCHWGKTHTDFCQQALPQKQRKGLDADDLAASSKQSLVSDQFCWHPLNSFYFYSLPSLTSVQAQTKPQIEIPTQSPSGRNYSFHTVFFQPTNS